MNNSAISPNKDVNELHKKLGYIFKQSDLLAEAFRHSSYTNEVGNLDLRDNERLEFLGDAVLDLAIGHILMELFPDANEGDLSKYRAIVVSEKGLSQVAKGLGLGDFLLLGRGEELTYGREKSSILANTIEALIGALYLDAGFTVSKEIINRLFSPLLEKIDLERVAEDYKSLVQEYTQQIYKTRPDYVHVKESGPAHDKTFWVALSLDGKIIAEGEGKSKKEAEQEAAKEAFLCLTREREET
jgi:ribonuclease III